MDITPKVRLLLWRILHGIVPTCLNLISRFVNVPPECKYCGDPIESNEHAFRDCPRSAECWNLFSFGEMGPLVKENIESWVWRIGRGLSKADQCFFACVL